MNEQKTWSQRFNELPRAARWAIIGTVTIVAPLMYFDYLGKFADQWNNEADDIRSRVRQVALTNSELDGGRSMEDLISGIGVVEKPADEAKANEALTETVNAIIKRHTVSKDDFKIRRPARLPTGTLEKIVRGSNKRVEKLTGELRFEATSENMLAIIAELESSPDIESVSHVRLNKLSGRGKLSVQLQVEAWILASVTRRGTGVSR